MAKTKQVFHFLLKNQMDAIAVYLNDMARKGWHFKEFKLGMVFEQGEPEDANYDVIMFPKGVDFDTKPSEEGLDFSEYCEAAGWELVDSKRKIYVFKKIQDDAEPILTAEEKAEPVIHMLWMDIICFFMIAAMAIASVINEVNANNPLNLFDGVWMFGCFLRGFAGLWASVHVIRSIYEVLIWKRQIAAGRELFIGRRNRNYPERPVHFDLDIKVCVGFLFLLSLCVGFVSRNLTIMILLLVIICCPLLILLYYAIVRPDREKAYAVYVLIGMAGGIILLILSYTMIDFKDDIAKAPITPKEVTEVRGKLLNYENFSNAPTIFGQYNYYYFNYGSSEEDWGDEYRYETYKSKDSELIQDVWKSILKENKEYENEIKQISPEPWGAEDAYSQCSTFYILYDKVILTVTESDYNADQIALIREKMGVN